MKKLTETIKEKITKLNQAINYHNRLYFLEDRTEISDEEYDALYLELVALNEEYPDFFATLKDNVLEQVGTQEILLENKVFPKFKHQKVMLSLNKAHTYSVIAKFLNDINKKIATSFSLIAQPKIDGLSISLHYQKGLLVHAVTRGDGFIGEDVFSNIKLISQKYLPLKLSKEIDMEIRGEVYMPVDVFNELNKDENFTFANPRNAASGTLRLLDSAAFEARKLGIYLYEIVDPEKHHLKTHEELMLFLKEEGFQIPPYQIFLSNKLDNLQNYLESYDRYSLKETQLDGVVLKVNEFALYPLLGKTAKFSHSQIAFKFSAIITKTVLKDIFVSIGKSGRVTYNAVLEPVVLDGSLISAATLHNYDYIKTLNLNLNDEIYIKKSGDIIPRVISLVTPKAQKDVFSIVLKCPFCKHDLIIPEGFTDQYCTNQNCPEILKRELQHFISRQAMNIISLGDQRLEYFFDLGFIKNIEDIYLLKNKREKILALEGYQSKSVDKLLLGIEESKKQGVEKVLIALGIKNIGPVTARLLLNNMELKEENFQQFLTYDFQPLINVHALGDTLITTLETYFTSPRAISLMHFFDEEKFAFNFQKAVQNEKLKNVSFVITGTLSKPRNFFAQQILANGGKVTTAISKKTTYLLYGEKAGSKLQKAQALKVNLLTEEEFNELLAN